MCFLDYQNLTKISDITMIHKQFKQVGQAILKNDYPEKPCQSMIPDGWKVYV